MKIFKNKVEIIFIFIIIIIIIGLSILFRNYCNNGNCFNYILDNINDTNREIFSLFSFKEAMSTTPTQPFNIVYDFYTGSAGQKSTAIVTTKNITSYMKLVADAGFKQNRQNKDIPKLYLYTRRNVTIKHFTVTITALPRFVFDISSIKSDLNAAMGGVLIINTSTNITIFNNNLVKGANYINQPITNLTNLTTLTLNISSKSISSTGDGNFYLGNFILEGTMRNLDDISKSITTQPVTTQPVTTQPVTTELVTTELVTTEPVTTEPATTEPVTTEPVTTEPATTEPVTTEPVTTEPATTEAVTTPPNMQTIFPSTILDSAIPSNTTNLPGTTISGTRNPAFTTPAFTTPVFTTPSFTTPGLSSSDKTFITDILNSLSSTTIDEIIKNLNDKVQNAFNKNSVDKKFTDSEFISIITSDLRRGIDNVNDLLTYDEKQIKDKNGITKQSKIIAYKNFIDNLDSTFKSSFTMPASTTPYATTPYATTPAFTTPAFTTPAFTTPAFTTPAFTTPAFTTPASTTPASTTPASTTPASTTPNNNELYNIDKIQPPISLLDLYNSTVGSENFSNMSNLEQFTSNNQQLRLNQLNDTYRKRYIEYIKIILVIVAGLISVWLCRILENMNYISSSISDFTLIKIIGITVIIVFIIYQNIQTHNVIVYDQIDYKSPVDEKATKSSVTTSVAIPSRTTPSGTGGTCQAPLTLYSHAEKLSKKATGVTSFGDYWF